MHDYMKALYHRFETPSRRAEYLDRKIKRTHSQLARLLGKSEKKLLLRIADMEDELRDEACLNSFMSGYRLAQGIQQVLKEYVQSQHFTSTTEIMEAMKECSCTVRKQATENKR